MQDTETLALKFALATMNFLSLNEKIILQNNLDTLSDLAVNSINIIEEKISRPLRARNWNADECFRLARVACKRSEALGVSYVFYGEEGYPPLLAEISDAPYAIFYRGKIGVLQSQCVTVVGTRKITPDGREAAREFAYEAASDGTAIVSGLALGVDGAAHEGALSAFYDGKTKTAKTAAVLAGGIDNIYPLRHKKMAGEIIKNGGCLLSEFPAGVPVEKWRFVSRNRIAAGLSKATVVVQAPPGSGAMITADFALGYGREVFFHEAAFSENAERISEMTRASLVANGDVKKCEMSPARYVDDGAQVVKNYKDFCESLSQDFFGTYKNERTLF